MNSESVDLISIAKKCVRDLNDSDYRYGAGAEKGKVDCVWFLARVLERAGVLTLEGEPACQLSPALEQILIAHWDGCGDPATIFKHYQSAVEKESIEIQGAPAYLETIGRGRVEKGVEKLLPNSIVQYHFKKKDGKWYGHAGVVSEICRDENGKFTGIRLLGAHNKSEGIGEKFVPEQELTKVYSSQLK